MLGKKTASKVLSLVSEMIIWTSNFLHNGMQWKQSNFWLRKKLNDVSNKAHMRVGEYLINIRKKGNAN